MQNKIVIVYDNLDSDYDSIRSRLIDITNFKSQLPWGYTRVYTQDIDSALQQAAALGYKHCFVNYLGHFLRNSDPYQQTIALGQPIVAHILKQHGYYNIHPQFLYLDLDVYKAVGEPKFSLLPQSIDQTLPSADSSQEHAHDDYTPMCITPNSQSQSVNINHTPFGTLAIAAYLNHGYSIHNFTQEIRNNKYCIYPEGNKQDVIGLFTDINYQPQNANVKQYKDILDWQVNSLPKNIYVLNTEYVLPETVGQIDHYLGVAAGVKAAVILHKNGFTDQTRVTLFDISDPALDYQRYINKVWDGDVNSYEILYLCYKQAFPKFDYIWFNQRSITEELEKFLQDNNISQQDFKTTWKRYQQLPKKYIKLDILNSLDRNRLVDLLDNETNYVWLSNAFKMEQQVFLQGEAALDQMFDDMMSSIKNSTTYVESCNRIYSSAKNFL